MLTWIFRALSSIVFLSAIVFTIPLAFDVGGRDCGLVFSLSLTIFYFFYSISRLSTPEHSRFRFAFTQLIATLQWLVIPALLIWSLSQFSVDSGPAKGWVERTFNRNRAQDESIQEWLFGRDGLVAAMSIGSWDKLLRWSVPVFQLGEGFCSLLVIQAAGQITRWLVNREGGDNWMVRLPSGTYSTLQRTDCSQIGLLALSASILSSTIYFLYRVAMFPEIGNVDAILIGSAITCAVFLCAWGIGSGRGNPVESSLLVRLRYNSVLVRSKLTPPFSSPTSRSASTKYSQTTSRQWTPRVYHRRLSQSSRHYHQSSWHLTLQ